MNKLILICGTALLLILLIGCTQPSCGDQQCQVGENDSTSENYCPNDCIDSNTPTTIDCDLDGDGIVDEKEQDKCEQDPPITSETCGDGTCDEKEEDTGSCPKDCESGKLTEGCGDGFCDKEIDETQRTCPQDCGFCLLPQANALALEPQPT